MPDVVVVGAGVIGASVAWHLARQGLRALVLEREASPGQGSTGRATGGFRAQYGTAINVRLSLLAREKLRRFEEETGVDPGYAPNGTSGWRAPRRSWAGLYEMSPDQHAVLGRAPECGNLFLCNGNSGNGVTHAPALGQLLAEIIVHGKGRSLDVHELRPSWFAEGEPNPAPRLL